MMMTLFPTELFPSRENFDEIMSSRSALLSILLALMMMMMMIQKLMTTIISKKDDRREATTTTKKIHENKKKMFGFLVVPSSFTKGKRINHMFTIIASMQIWRRKKIKRQEK